MRKKITACVLVAIQLCFAGFMIWKSAADVRAAAEKRAAILRDGEPVPAQIWSIRVFSFGGGEPLRCAFSLDLPGMYLESKYVRGEADDETGAIRFWRSAEEAGDDGLYLDSESLYQALMETEFVVSPQEAALICGKTPEPEPGQEGVWWEQVLGSDGGWYVNGGYHTVYAQMRVLGHDVLFDGLVIDGTFYELTDVSF